MSSNEKKRDFASMTRDELERLALHLVRENRSLKRDLDASRMKGKRLAARIERQENQIEKQRQEIEWARPFIPF